MADLIRMLGFTSRALEAQRFGLDVVGQNIANVNTPGYTRRVVDLAAVPPVEPLSAGGGVEVQGVRSLRDLLIDRRLWQEHPEEQRGRATADALAGVEAALGPAGSSIDGALDSFFDAFAALADAPTSSTARQEVILQGQSLASSFRDMSSHFESAIRETDSRVRGAVDEVNRLTARVASLNAALSGVDPATGESLQVRDELAVAIEELSGLVQVSAVQRTDGGFDIEINGGALVVGDRAYALGVSDRGVTGVADVTLRDATITSALRTGTLGGLIQTRDALIPGYQAQLDEIAASVVREVNAVHRQGYDANGAAGGDFFVPLAGSAGAASGLAVEARFSAAGGTDFVAASKTGAAGDNGNARALADLRDARVVDGNTATFTQAWSNLVYAVGRDSAAAQGIGDTHGEIVRQIRNLQDSVSGVSLDEEAADMLRFQRAYEANARFFRAIDDTLDILMRTFDA